MAKVCINCGRKIGFITGEHFEGLLCDDCYNEFGGMALIDIEIENDPEKYFECDKRIASEVDKKANPNVDKEIIKQAFHQKIFSRFHIMTGYEIEEYHKKIQDDLQKEMEAQEKEVKRINYANSFNEFYEYDVVTIINENHGTIDKQEMMRILSEHAKKGWKLHTIYSNELGKNAISVLGLGVNATACEDVLIFERRIQELE